MESGTHEPQAGKRPVIFYGWIVIAVGFITLTVAFGIWYSYSVFFLAIVDEFGWNITENPIHVHDMQATILHLCGIDHERLTFRYQGRQYRLTDVHGNVVRDLLV